MDRLMDSAVGFVVTLVGGSLLLFVAIAAPLAFIGEQTALPGALAKIEQVRADAAVVDPVQAEDVIGQVVEWNQTIVSKQTLNAQWWAGWAIPDEWDAVELIPVPR